MDSEDEGENVPKFRGVPGSIILINAFDPLKQGSAVQAHVATCRMFRQYLRSSSSHNVGVRFYGTDDSNSSVDIIPFTTPSLDDFIKLRDINISSLGQTKEFKLSDSLSYCSNVFGNSKKIFSSQTVIMLTRLDTPPVDGDQKRTFIKVVDLVNANIDIKIINISEDEYPVHEFYKNFLIEANKGRDCILPKPIWDPKDIEKIIHQQSHRHLAVAKLNFEIGNGICIGVGVYNLLIRSPQYQKKVDLEQETSAILTRVTKTVKVAIDNNSDLAPMEVEEDNQPKKMPLLKSELLYYQMYGGEKVEFTHSEMMEMKNPFGPPMMKLLGFKPAGLICKEKWFLKTGYFLFPNESMIEGSTVAFKAMHQACKETATVAICVLCTRVNARPYIAALSPCLHPLGQDVDIGFDVIPIPFIENVRDLPVTEDEDASAVSDDQKNFMKEMLRQIQFDYKADMFENPKVQKEFRAIEAKALDEDDIDPFIDTTKPSPDKFQDIREDLFEQLFGPFGVTAQKRSATLGGSARGNKNAKTFDINESELQERVMHGTVEKYTVPQLREILKDMKSSDLPALTGLKKQELCDLVYRYHVKT